MSLPRVVSCPDGGQCLSSELFKYNAKTRHGKGGLGGGTRLHMGATAPIVYSGINLTMFLFWAYLRSEAKGFYFLLAY